MIKCPFPDCGHRAEVITKVHCRNEHNMEREELFKKYGKPIFETYEPKKLKNNMKQYQAINNFWDVRH